MKTTSISVTDAARNFAECVNRVHYQNVSFTLLKNGLPVARLVPNTDNICLGRDLAEILRQNELSSEEATAWNRDLRTARRKRKPPIDRWR